MDIISFSRDAADLAGPVETVITVSASHYAGPRRDVYKRLYIESGKYLVETHICVSTSCYAGPRRDGYNRLYIMLGGTS